MKRILVILFFYCFTSSLFGQIPAGYYNEADGKGGKELQKSLSRIIDNHREVTYSSLWHHFIVTDTRDDSVIWDIYSDNPQGTNAYEFVALEDQCINVGGGEGVCYNREHTFCQSWFGGGTDAPYSDLFHIYPVDGYINSTRGNYPYGLVQSPSRIFSNGSKYGPNATPGAPSSNAFEPIDDYKGDIARSFFYMATRYMFEDDPFSTTHPMTHKSQLRPWALALLMNWHIQDPVSEKERKRNNAIYGIQQNRNPFIDYPELAGKIWGNDSIYPFYVNDTTTAYRPLVASFDIPDASCLRITFTMPVKPETAADRSNYSIDGNSRISNAVYADDTLSLFLDPSLLQGRTYHLIIRNIQGENLHFISDTSISFLYGYPSQRSLLCAWTFDSLLTAPNTSKRIASNIGHSDGYGVIYMDGSHGSSDFNNGLNGNQLNAYSGTLLGDPRTTGALAGKSLSVSNESANGQSMVFHFSTARISGISMSFACRRTSTGFREHAWEWSHDGAHYFPISGAETVPDTVQEFQLRLLDLENYSDLDHRDSLFLRLTFHGASGSAGNNRFDNIVIHYNPATNIAENPAMKNSCLAIYPNPSTGEITVAFSDEAFITAGRMLYCHDMNGKLCFSMPIVSSRQRIDLKKLGKGSYLFSIIGEKGVIIGREKIVFQ